MTTAAIHRHTPSTAGVLFAEDFDLPDLDFPPPAVVEEPLVIHAAPPIDIEAIRREAFERGRESAAADIDVAASERAAAAHRLLEGIAQALENAGSEGARVAEASAESVARLLLGMLAAALPALCARHGPTEVAAVARDVLPALAHAPSVAIRVSPHAMAMLADELARLDPDLRSRIVVTPSDAMPEGDVRITWQDGCATREAQRAWRAIADTLAPLGLLDARMACDADH